MSKRLDRIREREENYFDGMSPEDAQALIAVAEAVERFCALHNVTVDVQLSQGSRADFHKWQKDRDALYAAMRVFEGTEER